jgi:uncharacterized protein YcbK (DUF882 family)
MEKTSTSAALRRRTALAGLAGATFSSVALGGAAFARGPSVRPEAPSVRPEGMRLRSSLNPKHLSLVVAHTGETFSGDFADGSRYDEHRLARLNQLLRDYRTGEVKSIDPALFDLMARIQVQIGQPLRVLSGYRSWQTNQMLFMAGLDVAEHSLHIAAKAVDFMVPGIAADKLGDICRHCGAAGGLGIYQSGFVHVDTGPRRNWTGT